MNSPAPEPPVPAWLLSRIRSTFFSSPRVPNIAALFLVLGAVSACAHVASNPPSLENPQVLLLGEVHDNALGHRQRFENLRQRVQAGWRPALAMEQFDVENQALLSRAQQSCANADCVIRMMAGQDWDWPLYRPVIDLALRYQLPLIAANLSRRAAARVVREGIRSSFDAPTILAYHLATPLPPDILQGQTEAVVSGHCHMLPESMIEGMAEAQIARDIQMALAVRAQMPRDVVLLAGNGHLRNDIGVARWINTITPPLIIRSEAYAEQDTAGAYDVAHSIAPQPRADPCAVFSGALKSKAVSK